MNKDVSVYTSNGWGPCHMVKVYLSRKGVLFTEYNISLDLEARKRLIDMGHRSTPVTVIGDEKIVGYKPPKIDEALSFINWYQFYHLSFFPDEEVYTQVRLGFWCFLTGLYNVESLYSLDCVSLYVAVCQGISVNWLFLVAL